MEKFELNELNEFMNHLVIKYEKSSGQALGSGYGVVSRLAMEDEEIIALGTYLLNLIEKGEKYLSELFRRLYLYQEIPIKFIDQNFERLRHVMNNNSSIEGTFSTFLKCQPEFIFKYKEKYNLQKFIDENIPKLLDPIDNTVILSSQIPICTLIPIVPKSECRSNGCPSNFVSAKIVSPEKIISSKYIYFVRRKDIIRTIDTLLIWRKV